MSMKIQIFGMGCPKCDKLAKLAKEAADELGLNYELQKITNLDEMKKAGVMLTPALGINGTVKLSGKIPTLDEMKKILSESL